ncbi:MAG: ATP-binding protein [Deltaproteobacteria bacterium]|nr:ATP-binding protein [Deltaproteobacteria bacterium]
MDNKIILDISHDNEFFNRSSEMEEFYQHAISSIKHPYGIYLVGGKWIGKTELLKRVYHKLFCGQNNVVPIYYEFKADYTIEDFADDYLRGFIKQYFAFLTKNPSIVTENISLNKLEHLLADTELAGLSRLLVLHREARKHGDRMAIFKNAIGAPYHTIAYYNTPIFLMLDDFDITENTCLADGKNGIIKEYLKTLLSGAISFLITGYTTRLFQREIHPNSIKIMKLSGLNEEFSVEFMEALSKKYNIICDKEVLAVAARQVGGNPAYIQSIMAAARNQGRNLETLKDLMDVYIEELADGSIGFSLHSILLIKRLNALRLLHICIGSQNGISEEEMIEQMPLGNEEIRETISGLCRLSLLETSGGLIKWAGDKVTEDYICCLYETEVKGKSRDEAKISIVRKRLKEGFYIQGVKIKEKIKEDMLELLKRFNGQAVSKILFRNQDFLYKYSGKICEKGSDIKEDDKIFLPQIIGCFDNAKHERKDKDISIVVAYGFNNSRYDDENEVIWVAGVKELPSAVHAGDVESFIRQLNIIARDIKAAPVIRWMIGREGFTGEALKRLGAEGMYTTDATQLRILKNLIEDSNNTDKPRDIRGLASLKEFEIILPVSAKAELVAAKAVEEIGRNVGLDDDTITQIKTALVEACINAFEHSRVKNGKVYCKFIVGDDRLSLHIQNEGKDFDVTLQHETDDLVKHRGSAKRGRGILLMKQLMDEVRFEKMKGGTKLIMVKYIKKIVEGKNE